MKRPFALAAACLLITACATPPEPKAAPATADQVSAAIQAAEAAREKAAGVGHEWRDTGAMIKQAWKLMAEKRYDEALALAQKAEAQGELGFRQWLAQKDKPVVIPK